MCNSELKMRFGDAWHYDKLNFELLICLHIASKNYDFITFLKFFYKHTHPGHRVSFYQAKFFCILSLCIAFCVQTAALIPIGDIFLYANTAALAWTLPSDPTFFDDLRENERAQRRGDTKKIGYVDENGRVIAKVPYRRRPIVNPAFAKRSTNEDQISFKERLKLKIDRMKMHEKQSNRHYLDKKDLDNKSIEFHRSSRLELFGKIETLLTTLGRDGRQCVLYKLCESAQRAGQGSFMQEFFRAVFTLPKVAEFDEYYREYDQAHAPSEDCVSKYPGCNMDSTQS